MSTRAFYHHRGIEVDLAGELPLWLYNEIAAFHGYKDRDNPVLTCIGNKQPMYVWRHESGRYFVRHFPGGNPDSHHHGELRTISDEHRRQAEYARRAADRHGFTAQLEVSTGNHTRLDVGVFGEVNVGFEIQRSELTAPQAVRRATNSFAAGWPTAWVTDRQRDPQWADKVPTARLITRGGWDEQVPAPGTAWVSIGHYILERDTSAKSGWRYRREPRRALLDELAYLMPAGEIVPVAVGKIGKVDLAERAAIDTIDSATYPGASRWDPLRRAPKPHKEAPQRYSLDCRHSHPVGVHDLNSAPSCPSCGTGKLYYPQAIHRGYCGICSYNRPRGGY